MFRPRFGTRFLLITTLMIVGATANAVTLQVNCGQHSGLTSIGAALKVLQTSESHGPATIKVSGNCRENVVIQSVDRLTLTALKGASISDASGGKLDVIDVKDSRDVALSGFTINAGADGQTGASGVVCFEASLCRFSSNLIQGAADGAGILVAALSHASLDGDTLQGNNVGLQIANGGAVRADNVVTVRYNVRGVSITQGGFVNFGTSISQNNSEHGIFLMGNSTATCLGCSITANGADGVHVELGSFARLAGGTTITGNGASGVSLSTLSSAFLRGNVTGNLGGTDVLCNFQYSATDGAVSNIGGGTTNCVEP
jgi:Periplasmic copper-binding protein (NosD)